jgi:hypothetical protein
MINLGGENHSGKSNEEYNFHVIDAVTLAPIHNQL